MKPQLSSMTGFSAREARRGRHVIRCEIRGVNSRGLDVALRVPAEYLALESELRELVAQSGVLRGRVEVLITVTSSGGSRERPATSRGASPADSSPPREIDSGEGVHFDGERFERVFRLVAPTIGRLGVNEERSREILLGALLSNRELLTVVDGPAKPDPQCQEEILAIVPRTLKEFIKSRRAEGQRISPDITTRLKRLRELRKEILSKAKDAPRRFEERMLKRVADHPVVQSIDPARLAQEALMIAERVDITEEVVRFESHLDAFDDFMTKPGQGRHLDFLLQELLREANTMTSKAQDDTIQHNVVYMKGEIEKIREMVQNIE